MRTYCLVMAAAGATLAAGFAAHALWIGVAQPFGPALASAAVAGFLVLVSAALGLGLHLDGREVSEAPRSSSLPAMVETAMRRRPAPTAAALVALGAVIAKNPRAVAAFMAEGAGR